MPASNNPHQNHLLDALPRDEFERLLPHLELVPMVLGQHLHDSGSKMRHAYFPTTSIVSRLYVMEDGASAEIAVIGNEGIVGVTLFMGGETTTSQAVVQSAGNAYRLPASLMKQEFNRSGRFQQLLLRYTQVLLTHMAQSAACNRHHSLEQQLCRCLLLRLDRSFSNELAMTQEQIANMLGVRREGVTEAAGHLQNAGLIEYRRGHITVLDRLGLETKVCECYAVVKAELDRLLPETHDFENRLPIAGRGDSVKVREASEQYCNLMPSSSDKLYTLAPPLNSSHHHSSKEHRA
ncbi:MAG: helix-turn-helix domain-containing protein [Betaproteobacteria bacterium]|nr:helix-turn-helix domain-containing protein [Betaproteobacteria bacterium]